MVDFGFCRHAQHVDNLHCIRVSQCLVMGAPKRPYCGLTQSVHARHDMAGARLSSYSYLAYLARVRPVNTSNKCERRRDGHLPLGFPVSGRPRNCSLSDSVSLGGLVFVVRRYFRLRRRQSPRSGISAHLLFRTTVSHRAINRIPGMIRFPKLMTYRQSYCSATGFPTDLEARPRTVHS